MLDQRLTAAEVAEALGVPIGVFIDWHNTRGRAPRHQHDAGGAVAYTADDLVSWASGLSGFESCDECDREFDVGGVVESAGSVLGRGLTGAPGF